MEHDASHKGSHDMMYEKTNTSVTNTLDFLGPQGPIVLPLIGPPVHVQEFLLLFILVVIVADLLQMSIWRDRPLASNHPEGLASCK